MPLKNKVVVISGANGNLGRAVASIALEQGAKLALLDLAFGPDEPDYPSDRVTCYKLDMLDQQATADCFKKIINDIGPIDALCNTAGGFAMGAPVHETKDEDWSWMFDINVRTLLNAARAAVPAMIERKAGHIVNVAAAGALTGSALMAPYIAAKSTVIKVTESMDDELKQHGINVNCIMPSIIDTPPNREAMPDADFSEWVSPEQLAKVICFLASGEASGIHGAAVPVKNLV